MIKNLFDYSIKCDELSTDTNIKANIAQCEPNNNLTDYLNFYINNDNLFFNCENCQSSTRFDTSKEFTKLPPVLVITSQRFKTQKMYRTKVDTLITFPLNGLYISNNEYDLYGVINHSGDIENGHYTSIVKVDAKWIFFDDSKYEEVKDPHQLISERAFVLVYVNKRSPSEVSNLSKMMDALTIRIREMQLAHVLSEKAKSNCKKYFAIFSSRANPFA